MTTLTRSVDCFCLQIFLLGPSLALDHADYLLESLLPISQVVLARACCC